MTIASYKHTSSAASRSSKRDPGPSSRSERELSSDELNHRHFVRSIKCMDEFTDLEEDHATKGVVPEYAMAALAIATTKRKRGTIGNVRLGWK